MTQLLYRNVFRFFFSNCRHRLSKYCYHRLNIFSGMLVYGTHAHARANPHTHERIYARKYTRKPPCKYLHTHTPHPNSHRAGRSPGPEAQTASLRAGLLVQASERLRGWSSGVELCKGEQFSNHACQGLPREQRQL